MPVALLSSKTFFHLTTTIECPSIRPQIRRCGCPVPVCWYNCTLRDSLPRWSLWTYACIRGLCVCTRLASGFFGTSCCVRHVVLPLRMPSGILRLRGSRTWRILLLFRFGSCWLLSQVCFVYYCSSVWAFSWVLWERRRSWFVMVCVRCRRSTAESHWILRGFAW